jgi:hypothetical protein
MTEEEFFLKIPEWIKADKKDWNIVTIVAYFCNKYEQKNGIRYKLVRSKAGPTSTKETRDFSKLFSIFAPENYKDLPPEQKASFREEINKKIYNYINWMFDYKFRSGDRSVNGTQLFLSPSIINEFERMYSKFVRNGEIKNSFSDLKSIIEKEYPIFLDRNELTTLDDLNMIQRIWIQKGKPENIESKVINLAIKMGILNEK